MRENMYTLYIRLSLAWSRINSASANFSQPGSTPTYLSVRNPALHVKPCMRGSCEGGASDAGDSLEVTSDDYGTG